MESLSKFLTERIPNYSTEDAEFAIAKCDQIYTRDDGALGVRRKARGILEVLFFAADSPQTKQALIRQGDREHEPEVIFYNRPKHGDKPYTHGKAFWRKLCHGC